MRQIGILNKRYVNGTLRYFGDFECPRCNQIVERDASNGKKAKTCGSKECQPGNHSHGYVGTGIYNSWANMKQRCDNPKNSKYKYYGARGIKYEPLWKDFNWFLEDMLEGWEEGLEIDRIDSSKGYYKDNVRWLEKGLNACKEKAKPVAQYDKQGNELGQYASTALAGQELGVDPQGIARAARGERKSYMGYVWAYIEAIERTEDNQLKVAVRKQRETKSQEKHGMFNTPQYISWRGAKARRDKKTGELIGMDKAWDKFSDFWEDMKEGYEEGLNLGRLDNSKPFSKDNCIWISKEQASGRARALKVNQLGKVTGDVIKEWTTIKEAGTELNIDTSSITKVCKGKKKSAGGFNWQYV
jgi:hypothetical protein